MAHLHSRGIGVVDGIDGLANVEQGPSLSRGCGESKQGEA
jgi:hypothetical protein